MVDFGTAATFNVLDAHGRFLGGAIAPGWAVVSGLPARADGAAAAGEIHGRGAAGHRTEHGGARSGRGTILGYRGLVREIIAGLRAELGADARVIATGGDARFLAARTGPLFDAVDPDLTLHGLRVIAARVYAQARSTRHA